MVNSEFGDSFISIEAHLGIGPWLGAGGDLSRKIENKHYLPATQPEESITPQSSRRPNELFASDDV